eukprot:TRINITY_DN23602_c0_g1_i1.p1 TRINITY_DN23602_c0_g1~~TRINITY_DN23602_c0_g1_i1.p1  ORF type:complete len:736 (-),score=139.10 TRINITY_DN23602_c0_g1_i1:110-2317(-)
MVAIVAGAASSSAIDTAGVRIASGDISGDATRGGGSCGNVASEIDIGATASVPATTRSAASARGADVRGSSGAHGRCAIRHSAVSTGATGCIHGRVAACRFVDKRGHGCRWGAACRFCHVCERVTTYDRIQRAIVARRSFSCAAPVQQTDNNCDRPIDAATAVRSNTSSALVRLVANCPELLIEGALGEVLTTCSLLRLACSHPAVAALMAGGGAILFWRLQLRKICGAASAPLVVVKELVNVLPLLELQRAVRALGRISCRTCVSIDSRTELEALVVAIERAGSKAPLGSALFVFGYDYSHVQAIWDQTRGGSNAANGGDGDGNRERSSSPSTVAPVTEEEVAGVSVTLEAESATFPRNVAADASAVAAADAADMPRETPRQQEEAATALSRGGHGIVRLGGADTVAETGSEAELGMVRRGGDTRPEISGADGMMAPEREEAKEIPAESGAVGSAETRVGWKRSLGRGDALDHHENVHSTENREAEEEFGIIPLGGGDISSETSEEEEDGIIHHFGRRDIGAETSSAEEEQMMAEEADEVEEMPIEAGLVGENETRGDGEVDRGSDNGDHHEDMNTTGDHEYEIVRNVQTMQRVFVLPEVLGDPLELPDGHRFSVALALVVEQHDRVLRHSLTGAIVDGHARVNLALMPAIKWDGHSGTPAGARNISFEASVWSASPSPPSRSRSHAPPMLDGVRLSQERGISTEVFSQMLLSKPLRAVIAVRCSQRFWDLPLK